MLGWSAYLYVQPMCDVDIVVEAYAAWLAIWMLSFRNLPCSGSIRAAVVVFSLGSTCCIRVFLLRRCIALCLQPTVKCME